MFVNIQSSWLSNKNTCMGNWHSLFWGCSQILSNNDSNIVLNNYKQFDHVCGETVCAYWSWTFSQTNTNSFTTYMVKLFVHIEVELTFFQTNTNSFTMYAVKLFVHIEVELIMFQTNTISLPCTWLWVLWVYQETHLLPWISMIFSGVVCSCTVAVISGWVVGWCVVIGVGSIIGVGSGSCGGRNVMCKLKGEIACTWWSHLE